MKTKTLCGTFANQGVLVVAMAVLGVGCQARGLSNSTGEVELQQSSLTGTQIARVLGFEKTSAPWDWSIIQSGVGTIGSSTVYHTEGSRSLSLSGASGYVPFQSVALSSLGQVSRLLAYDFRLPPEAVVDSPYWQGQGLAFLNSVTAGLYNVYLGEVEWTGLPVGKFSTVSYALSDDVLARVRGSYQDLKLTLVANVPSHSTGTYIFDAVRFVQQVNVQVQVLDSDSNPRPGLTVNVYSGANQTSYTGVTNSSGVAAIALPIGSYRFGVTDQGFTYFNSPNNTCSIPGACPASVVIVERCLGISCTEGPCYTQGACDPWTGRCSTPPKPAGTRCRAAVGECDLAEYCDGVSADCPVDAKVVDGTACDDHSTCTAADHCERGTCVGSTLPDGTPCNDGDDCTENNTCQSGLCTGHDQGSNCSALPAAHILYSLPPQPIPFCGDTPPPDGAFIYSAGNDSGLCHLLQVGFYREPGDLGIGNDTLSSMAIGSNVRVVTYWDAFMDAGRKLADPWDYSWYSAETNQWYLYRNARAYWDGGWNYTYVGGDADDKTSAMEVFPATGGRMAAWYLGDYPANREVNWAQDVQGIAHDDINWFITQKSTINQIPLTQDLNVDHHGLSVGIPPELSDFDHFGDPDQSHGFLFVPVQRPSKTRPAIAVFNASDLSLVAWQTLPSPDPNVEGDWQGNGGAWVAVRVDANDLPDVGRLYVRDDITSGSVDPPVPPQTLVEFQFIWSLLRLGALVLLNPPRNIYLVDQHEMPGPGEMPVPIRTIQGGAFNAEGTLFYVVNGYCDTYGALRIFSVSGDQWLLQAEAVAESVVGAFRFEQHPKPELYGNCNPGSQEPEGLDFFDVDGLGIHGVSGQLHVLLLRNSLPGSNGVWLKHYSY